MIILKHLTIERFRLLRSMNLHFPQRGSILIQGPNESGKSALIESIYFALYGEPLNLPRGKRPLDDLILYGAANAQVTLALSVGATELTIARTIERGKGQSIVLQIYRLGLPDEPPVTTLATANARIIAELGHMNGETLRNSCLIEQKGLNRLETISGTEREKTIRNLLGLKKFASMTEHFKVIPSDELQLKEATERLQLAEIQSQIPLLSNQLGTVETALDSVKVCHVLVDIQQQETEITEQEQTLETIQTQRLAIKSRQGRIQQLKKADTTLAEIIASYEDMAEARQETPELERQIAELERREQEDLPALNKRVNELAELTRSFGTLQRMSNDLLTAVDTIKELEHDVRHHKEIKQDRKTLDEQVAQARGRLLKAQQSWQELNEQRRTGRPQLESRLQRMKNLAERLAVLQQLEKRYTQRLASRTQAEENALQLKKVQKDLRETEQEFALVEREAKLAQQHADSLEKTWRQLSIRRQLEEWVRQKGLSQGLTDAEQHVHQARQQQSQLTQRTMDGRKAASRYLLFLVCYIVAALICLIVAFTQLGSIPVLSFIAFVIMLAFGYIAFKTWGNYNESRNEERFASRQEQEAISRVGMMVAAREATLRISGNNEALAQIENEIRSFGGSIPLTFEEAQQFLDLTKDQGDLGDVQVQMKEKLDAANAARNQVNVTMEAVAALRKERTRLEEQRRKEHWDDIEENLRVDQIAVERMQQEITLLAGQESLPTASINARLQTSPIIISDSYASGPMFAVTAEEAANVPELELLADSTIKAIEHEIASLDGKLDVASDLAAQIKMNQEALDILLVRLSAIEEDEARYEISPPELQMERAREQQMTLRSALQSLQDSLRLRVKPLGVAFGQAAIGNEETLARKQLEELHITLGKKVMLQERLSHYNEILKERQESLSEHYKQLAKISNTLGSWIVPPNPFAEALVALRTRCEKELHDASEESIQQELNNLQMQEGASSAKISLCRQSIQDAQETIAQVLTTRNRTTPKSYTRADIITVWPLLENYSTSDRSRLEEERATLEDKLAKLEKQELELSNRLGIENVTLDLPQVRALLEQAERSYQTKKRGNLLVKAVDQRLLHKMIPRTEYYMQQILPLLTAGRYHDVHLLTDLEEQSTSGGPLQIQVWDSAANEYLPTSALSGGTADQLALALRIAFAIASLPRELNTTPGFLLLDEPLSSFDRSRTQALVNVVTGQLLSQHFEQIILISHSSAFDPAMFPYHLYVDNGLVVESNLPVVLNLPSLDGDEEEGALIGAIPASVYSNE